MQKTSLVKPALTENSADYLDKITLLRSRVEMRKTLTFEDGTWTKTASANAKHFDVSEHEVGSLDALVDVLRKTKSSILIYGAALPTAPRKNVRRTASNFAPVQHFFIMFDLDALEGPADPAAAASIARGLLPAEFHTARCAWNATSGHALKEGEARLRLIFWTSRPITLDESRLWASRVTGMKIDRSIYRTVQPIFIEAPRVIGALDPVERRWGFLDGNEAVAVPDDLAVETKAAQDRTLTAPDHVIANAAHMIDSFVRTIESRGAKRVQDIGRRLTFMAVANDAFDRAITDDVAEAAIAAWFFHDDDSKSALRECLSDDNVPDTAALAARIRTAGEKVAGDGGFDGEPLDETEVARMVDDAAHSRASPFGVKYREPLSTGEALGPVVDPDEALSITAALEELKREPSETACDALATAIDDSDMALSDAARAKALVAEIQVALVLGDDPREVIEKIEKALGEQVFDVQPKEAKPVRCFMWADALEKSATAPLTELVRGVMTAGEIVVAAGSPGSMKTTDLLHLCWCVAEGKPYHGRKTIRGGALFVGGENKAEEERRIIADREHYARQRGLPFGTLLQPTSFYSKDGKPTKHELAIIEQAKLFETAGHPLRLIVIDNLRRVIAPGKSSEEGDAMAVMNALDRIKRATGATVMIIHHHVRDGSRFAGSGAIESGADSVWYFEVDKSRKGTITFQKLRLGDKLQSLAYGMAFRVVAHNTDGEPIQTVVSVDRATDVYSAADENAEGEPEGVRLLRAVIAEPAASLMRLKTLAAISGPKSTVMRKLESLGRENLVAKTAGGKWSATKKGVQTVTDPPNDSRSEWVAAET